MSLIISQMRWPSLAQDLAILSAPGTPITDMDKVCTTYGMTEQEIAKLLTVPAFFQLYKKELENCQSLGTKAAATYRSMSLAQALSEKLFRRAQDDKMEAKDAVKLLELFMKSGGLLDKDTSGGSVNVQVNAGLQLPLPQGLSNPKLAHLDVPLEAPDGI